MITLALNALHLRPAATLTVDPHGNVEVAPDRRAALAATLAAN
ncbi:MAG: hypothetical protein AAF698_06410 [Pseudomonadota bacterium]